MRLTKLKLSGFKSFVDPTSVLFPGQLVGVVGPNGCGKSNVIDAVRWVLGESKASELRGESIQDVIFKGSGSRKEVSRASVELFFDNAQGRAAGQWSQYAEITVKRVLDREGNSNYSINSLAVRRRDVIDLFLGTGLGPRAYAIIGQGMISRIIEAKPDELRGFLEEAAGVTKYKERRRETESRLEDARENIARVCDIRNELDGQIARLQAQAEVARQYRELQQQLARGQNLLWLKRRNDARFDKQRLAREVDLAINTVEAETARLRETEARVEECRANRFAASDALHAAQAEIHVVNADVRRLEAEIQHIRDARTRLEARLAQLATEDNHWNSEITRVEAEELRWQALLANSLERAGSLSLRHSDAAAQLTRSEAAVAAANSVLSEARRALNTAEQELRLADAERSHALRAQESLKQRSARNEQERQALDPPDPVILMQAEERLQIMDTALASHSLTLDQLEARQQHTDAAFQSAREQLQALEARLTQITARRDALAQLQERVKPADNIGDWLQRHQLSAAQPLWRVITVASGWETAVEAILRERFAALPADAAIASAALADPPPAILALALLEREKFVAHPSSSLRSKITCADPRWQAVLDEWLSGVECVESLPQHLAQRHGILVCPDGHVLTEQGLTLYVPDERIHGVIERQREIELLDAEIQGGAEQVEFAKAGLSSAQDEQLRVREELARVRQSVETAQKERHAAEVQALHLTQARNRHEERTHQIERELAEIADHLAKEVNAQLVAETETARSQEALEQARTHLEQALEAQNQADVRLREARALENQLARETQDVGFSERECLTKLADNARAADTAKAQRARITTERDAAVSELTTLSDAAEQEKLQQALTLKTDFDAGIAQKREALEAASQMMKRIETERARLEQGLQPARERINELKLKQQAALLAEEQCDQRLLEGGIATLALEEALASYLSPSAREAALQQDNDHLEEAIKALGPVNLAALEELSVASERRGYLDAQAMDLTTAIHTLEDAIRRIDMETRAQLQDTYDKVNREFGILFPQLFGGGDARLLLTGEEILDAGIQIMAQPPGKKNTTIYLLSGGEKALAAIALVFALFRLNPAPFCLLDEVDAPLDDSNTVRFCDLVKRMAVDTQFIFITHNKIAMEMAQQLIGVTMQERGVSRVVEVDIAEAMRMNEERVGA